MSSAAFGEPVVCAKKTNKNSFAEFIASWPWVGGGVKGGSEP
jgi:hypothetical protein